MFFALALAACAALAGCGRRGPLELPPGAPAQAKQDPSVQADRQAAILNQDTPAGIITSPNQVVQTPKSAAALAAEPPSPPINGPQAPKTGGGFFMDSLL